MITDGASWTIISTGQFIAIVSAGRFVTSREILVKVNENLQRL